MLKTTKSLSTVSYFHPPYIWHHIYPLSSHTGNEHSSLFSTLTKGMMLVFIFIILQLSSFFFFLLKWIHVRIKLSSSFIILKDIFSSNLLAFPSFSFFVIPLFVSHWNFYLWWETGSLMHCQYLILKYMNSGVCMHISHVYTCPFMLVLFWNICFWFF